MQTIKKHTNIYNANKLFESSNRANGRNAKRQISQEMSTVCYLGMKNMIDSLSHRILQSVEGRKTYER